MHRLSIKLLVSIAVLAAAASVAGLGTFATFTSSTTATHTVSSGTVTVALGTPGAANRLTVNATAVAPGDTFEFHEKGDAFTLVLNGEPLTTEKGKKYEGPTFRARDGSLYKILTPEKLTNPETSSVSIKVARGSNRKNITIHDDGSVVIE